MSRETTRRPGTGGSSARLYWESFNDVGLELATVDELHTFFRMVRAGRDGAGRGRRTRSRAGFDRS